MSKSPRPLSITAVFFLALGGVYLWGGREYPLGTLAKPGGGFYPLIVAIVLIVLSALLFLHSHFSSTAEEVEPFPKGKDRQRVWAVIVLLACFAAFIKPLGFVICGLLMMAAVFRIFGLRSWPKICAISVVVVLVSYYLFNYLGAPLPRGTLFD